ncbi:hypothetical protein D917_10550 [Trichinella nativa]|uniref:Uncharacterized protein n=1 Tax=Trichinella nativa TaxID=6335 RepID=A0A1Y3EFR0_9BILA|nr:hypothetical protein D917_10550 [Trichinella nativa]
MPVTNRNSVPGNRCRYSNMGLNRRKDAVECEIRLEIGRGNNQYAVKVKAIYDRCNPRVLIERPGDNSIVSDDYRLERVHN